MQNHEMSTLRWMSDGSNRSTEIVTPERDRVVVPGNLKLTTVGFSWTNTPTTTFMSCDQPSWYQRAMESVDSLTTLDLSKTYVLTPSTKLRVAAIQQLGNMGKIPLMDFHWAIHLMQCVSTLVHVNLSNCGLGDLGLLTLCIFLESNRTVRSLDVSNNSVTFWGLESFFTTVFVSNFTISSISYTTDSEASINGDMSEFFTDIIGHVQVVRHDILEDFREAICTRNSHIQSVRIMPISVVKTLFIISSS